MKQTAVALVIASLVGGCASMSSVDDTRDEIKQLTAAVNKAQQDSQQARQDSAKALEQARQATAAAQSAANDAKAASNAAQSAADRADRVYQRAILRETPTQ